MGKTKSGGFKLDESILNSVQKDKQETIQRKKKNTAAKKPAAKARKK